MRDCRKVCIVGFAGGFEHVPWKERGWEYWGFNQLYRYMAPSKRCPFTRWFELHTPDYFLRDIYGNKEKLDTWPTIAGELRRISEGALSGQSMLDNLLIAALAHVGKKPPAAKRHHAIPVYLPRKNDLVPRARVYPRSRVERLTPHGKYHAGSFDWMVALAILEGFRHIRITGVNFANGGEPISARPCLEYWLGVAEGRGISTEVIGGDCFRIFHLMRSDVPYGFAPWRLVEDSKP